ncbi:hypothetical protein MA16_Dca008238 [Dendrobium catenatum]|uniref:Ricin B-like lectin R40G3 n=2 Tax=Dendrobium catenatum TaxID=906689 RepID=A0A2I0X6N1_9ASPA|nr:hypothetical protein MA16_Dca008238 [Dendrobium catenatum]
MSHHHHNHHHHPDERHDCCHGDHHDHHHHHDDRHHHHDDHHHHDHHRHHSENHEHYRNQPPPPASYPPAQPYPYADPYAQRYGGEIISHNHNSTFRIYTKAEECYSLSIREDSVVLVPTNHHDDFQHWYKDFRWGNEVKDEEGLPGFALINKATGLAIKHSLGAKHPVRLIPFNPEYIDESILWTESHDTGEGFRHIRMVNNIRLGFDAFHGDKDHGGVHDGTIVVLWEWLKGKNQRWKIVPFY